MDFNPIADSDIKALAALVAADRFSTGASILDLHARDQSAHPACRPEAVVWPASAAEVAAILKYANERRIPIT
ncbi:MAG: FAD-binding oxidoreductase, partial [Desulfobacteraceae bacterium]